MEYHEAIRKMMRKNEVTVTGMSVAMGISRQATDRHLKDNMRTDTLIKVCKAAGCQLYIGDEDMMIELE